MEISLTVSHNGESSDLGSICQGQIKLTYEKVGRPSVLEFSVVTELSDKTFGFYEGDSVGLVVDGVKMFYGYIFTRTRTREKIIYVKAYDQLRYFKNRDTYIYSGQSASSLLRLILADFKIKAGDIEETGYILPDRIESNQSLFDIILTATELTRNATGKDFVLYDDYGKICYKNVQNMVLPLLAKTEMDGLIDFTYETSIDSDTYNRVKLFIARESSLCYSAESAETIEDWGVLQYTEVLTRKELLSGAAFNELARSILRQKNRVSRNLVIEDMGDVTVRAGSRIWVYIESDENIAKTVVVNKAVHTFENGLHRMKLSLDLGG